MKIVISGAGAAGHAIVQLLHAQGASNIVACARTGAIHRGETYADEHRQWIADNTNPEGIDGTLHEALVGADVFIGVSAPNLLRDEHIATMAAGADRARAGEPRPRDRPDRRGEARRRRGHRSQRLPQPDQQRAGVSRPVPRPARRRQPATSPRRCWSPPPRRSPTASAPSSSTPATSCPACSTRGSPRPWPRRSAARPSSESSPVTAAGLSDRRPRPGRCRPDRHRRGPPEPGPIPARTGAASRCTPSTCRPTATPSTCPSAGVRPPWPWSRSTAAWWRWAASWASMRPQRAGGDPGHRQAADRPDRGPPAGLRGRVRRPRRRRPRTPTRYAPPGCVRRGSSPPGWRPPFIGIRFKCFEAPTRRRGIRTLDLFLATLVAGRGELPAGLVLTFPKVSTVSQVEAMVQVCRAPGVGARTARRAPPVRDPGRDPAADPRRRRPRRRWLRRSTPARAGSPRCTTAPTTTAPRCRSPPSTSRPTTRRPTTPSRSCRSRSPAPECTSPTGRPTSCRSATPTRSASPGGCTPAWSAGRLQRGFYQGWDLHAGQLPTRFLANFAFYREGFPAGRPPPRRLRRQHRVRHPRRAGHGPSPGPLPAARLCLWCRG